MNKIVAIHQPNFLPWLGFFDKMAKADVFIILDNVQYEKNAMINRNKIKTSQGEKWLTVPVKVHLPQEINTVMADESQNWRTTHLKTLLANYKKSKNFDFIYHLIEKNYFENNTNLTQFNLEFIKLFGELLKIKTEIVLASDLKVEGRKNELLINLINKVDGTNYLSGQGAKDYLIEEIFNQAEIKINWQKFKSPIYPQLFGEFIPNLSVLDFVMNADYENYFAKK